MFSGLATGNFRRRASLDFMLTATRKSLKNLGGLLLCAGRYWSADNVSTTGAALAYFCAFSIAPLLVILLTIAGWILGAEAAFAQVGAQVTALFGPATAKILLDAVKSSQQMHGLVSTVTSVVSLFIGATTVLSALQSALNQIWHSGKLVKSGVWGWIQSRFLSLGFILALGFLLLVSLTVSTGLSHVQSRMGGEHAALLSLVGVLDFLVSLLVIGSLFGMIFRFMPARRLPWRVAAAGGFLTAILFEAGRWAIGLYLAHSTQPSAFGAAASFAALLLWLYYTAQIFLFGAEFTACLGRVDREDTQARPAPSGPTTAANDADATPVQRAQ
jgi:membrane protein